MIYLAFIRRKLQAERLESFTVIKRLAAGLLLLPVVALLGCGGDLPQGAFARVGQSYLPEDQLRDLVAVYEATGRAPDEKTQSDEFRLFEQRVAEYLVTLEVLKQEGPNYKITVTEQAVQGEINQIKQMFQGDEKKFSAALDKLGVTPEQFAQSVREGLLVDAMKEAVTEDVTVSDQEVKAYYESHKGDFVQPETREARHILIAPVPQGSDGATTTPEQVDWDAAKAEAEKVRSQIRNGADFASEAAEYSDDLATKDSGGELGTITRGQMVPAFEEAVFALKDGELSQPIKTQYGYHLIEVTEITDEKQLSFNEVKESISSTLLEQRQTAAWDGWVAAKQLALGVEYREGLAPPAATVISESSTTTTSSSAP